MPLNITTQIIALREHGLKYREIAELLDRKENNCRVLYWKFKNRDKDNLIFKRWRDNNKEHCKEYKRKWVKDNPDKIKVYQYKRKCKRAGVKPM